MGRKQSDALYPLVACQQKDIHTPTIHHLYETSLQKALSISKLSKI
jgi:hypothetical protein